MTRKEIIDSLKTNERMFMFLSEEEKGFLRKYNGNYVYLDHHFEWRNRRDTPRCFPGAVYRLPEDYTEPEPKDEYEIIDIDPPGDQYRWYNRHTNSYELLFTATSYRGFAGVQFDGQEHADRWYLFLNAGIDEGGQISFCEMYEDEEPAVPVRVRFKK